MINTEERWDPLLEPSFVCRCLLKDEPITLWLTDFYFYSTVSQQKKYSEKFDESWFCSLADSLLKFSTKICIFIKHLKN